MKILLDTHCLLWFLSSPEKMSKKSIQIIESVGNEIYISAASAWEISIKSALGKLKLPSSPKDFVSTIRQRNGFIELPISISHAEAVLSLPSFHADPFDRILISQANEENLKFMTADVTLKQYDCDFIWAK